MSKYTTQLRFICESEAGYLESQGYNKVNEIVHAARSNIFSFEYPIFDESYKADLETKILKHYYTREIAAETYGRWKLFLESRMLEIMPYYNQLYSSTLQDYNILEDVNYTRSGSRNTDEDGTHLDTTTTDADSTINSEAWDKYSDTPQGSVQNIDNDSYLTNARKNTDNSTTTTDTTSTNNGSHTRDTLEEYTELIKGKMPGKSYMQLIQEFRDTILNIDKMIIDDLADLFMMIY